MELTDPKEMGHAVMARDVFGEVEQKLSAADQTPPPTGGSIPRGYPTEGSVAPERW